MANSATATLDANDEVCGPLSAVNDQRVSFHIVITGTITVSVQRRINGGTFVTITKPDGATAASYTASASFVADAPGDYQLIASGTAGGSAVCNMLVHR